ncbi:MAG: hypothetical protein KDD41_04820 [Flavobacteriales bacterium]|nr:hypothetical protein [Flavobacteriales bacterium]
MSGKLKVESSKLKVESSKWGFAVVCLLVSICCVQVSCGSDEAKTTELPENDSTQTQVLTNTGEVQIIEPALDDEIAVLEKDGIVLTELKSEPGEAVLTLNTTSFQEGENHLNFAVEGASDYHIAYLANNYDLSEFSTDVFEMEFLYGNNVFLAFLTDKNNIAIKSNKGSVLKNAVVGDMENLFNMEQPHLFYYLPKAATSDPILDFYLVNTAIGSDGNKVKVTINQTDFIVGKWAAYRITGLPGPQNTIRIQLLDKNGKLINGPFNDSGERSFSVINKAS